MKLYVMRHGPAEDDAATGRDADRALTTAGRDRVRAVSKSLLVQGEGPSAILSSPLVRAVQTAEIVASVMSAVSGEPVLNVEVKSELGPGRAKLTLLSSLLTEGRKRVMIVGHEPDFSALVSHLVGRPMVQGMGKAMVVGLKLSPLSEPAAPGALPFAANLRFVLDPKSLEWDRG